MAENIIPAVLDTKGKLRNRLDEYCERTGFPMSNVIRMALDDYLSAKEGKQKPVALAQVKTEAAQQDWLFRR